MIEEENMKKGMTPERSRRAQEASDNSGKNREARTGRKGDCALYARTRQRVEEERRKTGGSRVTGIESTVETISIQYSR